MKFDKFDCILHHILADMELKPIGKMNHDRNDDSHSFATRESESDLELHFEESSLASLHKRQVYHRVSSHIYLTAQVNVNITFYS